MNEGKERGISTDLVALLIIVIPLLFVGIGARDVWAPDEPRFAQIAREMLESGDWLVPRMNDTPVALLPPMTYWTMAAASVPFGGVTEFSSRLPIALAALVTILAVFYLGRSAFGPTGGVVSALMLATSIKFLQQAEWLQCDMLLVCFVTLSLAAFWRAYHAQPAQSKRGYFPMYIFMALGTLTKGPMAVLLPAMVILLFLLMRKDVRHLLVMRLPTGILVWLLIVIPWFVAVHFAAGPEFTRELVLKQNFGMFFETWSHEQPFFYYLLNVPWAFLPWMVLVPAAVVSGVRARRMGEPFAIFLVVWFAALFLFFSVSQAKQVKYLLPAFPALALFTGGMLVSVDPKGALFRWGVAVPLMFPVLAVVAGVVVLLFGWGVGRDPAEYRSIIDAATPFVILLAVGMVAAVVMMFRFRQLLPAVVVVALTIAVALPLIRLFVYPEANGAKSTRVLCEQAAGITPEGERIGLFGVTFNQAGPYLYYSGRRLEIFSLEDNGDDAAAIRALRDFMSSSSFRLCFVDGKEYRRMDDNVRSGLKEISSHKVGHREMLLIANY